MRKGVKRFAFLAGSLLLAAQPDVAATSPERAPLEQQLAAIVQSQPTELGIAAFDPSSTLYESSIAFYDVRIKINMLFNFLFK